MMLLRLVFVFFLGSLAQTPSPPRWPTEFHWEIPPFLIFDYSFARQEYKIFINTQSPDDWAPVGVSGTLYYDCDTNVKATAYAPFGPLNTFSQCMYGEDFKNTMPSCRTNMFPIFWKDVSYYGTTKLSTNQPVYVWNVTINEDAWPGLNLGGYESYKLYFETTNPDPLQRIPVGLSTDSLLLWQFKWRNTSTPVFIPTDCNPVEHIRF